MTATSTTRKPSLQPQAPTTRSGLELPAVGMPQLTATSRFTLQPQSPIPSRDTLNNSQRRRGLNLGDYSIPCCHHFNASPATNHMGLETPCDQLLSVPPVPPSDRVTGSRCVQESCILSDSYPSPSGADVEPSRRFGDSSKCTGRASELLNVEYRISIQTACVRYDDKKSLRIYLPSHKVSKKMLRSSLLISRTLVSNELCRVRALHRSLASRNARPNSLGKVSSDVKAEASRK